MGEEPMRFAVPYVLAVSIATMMVWVAVTLLELFEPVPVLTSPANPILLIVWLVIAGTAFIPALLTVIASQRLGYPATPLGFAFWGAATGVVSVLLMPLVSSGFDLSNQWVWRNVWRNFIHVPTFGLAGLAAGYCFGLVRNKLSR